MKKSEPKINWIRNRNRVLAWALLIALTILISLYPAHLDNVYHTIQAPYIFQNLWLFSVIFCFWLALLFIILFSLNNYETMSWEGVSIAIIFGVGFIGFWILITPLGGQADAIYNMAHIQYLTEVGGIPIGNNNLAYFDFPGMHILITSLNLICGFNIFLGSATFLLFNVILFSGLLYIFCFRLLKNSMLAFLCVTIIIMSSAIIVDNIRILYPRSIGFTYLMAILILVISKDAWIFNKTVSEKIAILIIFVAVTISYFPVSFLILLLLSGIYIIQRISNRCDFSISISTILLFSIILLGWEMYWTWHTFYSLISFLPRLSQDLFSGGFLTTSVILASSSASGRLPFWALAIRYFWWALLVIGTLLVLLKLAKIKKLSSSEILVIGGLLAVLALTIMGLFGTERGSQFARYLMYAPFFSIPIVIEFLWEQGSFIGKRAVFLAAPVVILGLPSFLMSVNTVSTDALYSYEYAASNYLHDLSGEQEPNLCVYYTTPTSIGMTYYSFSPNRTFRGIPIRTLYSGNEEAVWRAAGNLVDQFQDSNYMRDSQKLFIINEKSLNEIQHLTGSSADPIGWDNIIKRLSNCDLVYANDHVTFYVPID